MTDEELEQFLAQALAPVERPPDLAFVAMTERLVTHEQMLARRRRVATRRGRSDALAAAALLAGLGLFALWRPEWAHTAALPLLSGLAVVAWLMGHDWGADPAN